MMQFVKILPVTRDCFNYICRAFPALTIEKLKAGIFDSPQISPLAKDLCFVHSITDAESAAWQSFVLVTQNTLGNRKAENYQMVEDMLSKFKDLGVKISTKVYYLFSHFDHFLTNLGDLSEEHGERFDQDIKVMEERHQGRWDFHMIAYYCWSLQRDLLGRITFQEVLQRKFVNIG